MSLSEAQKQDVVPEEAVKVSCPLCFLYTSHDEHKVKGLIVFQTFSWDIVHARSSQPLWLFSLFLSLPNSKTSFGFTCLPCAFIVAEKEYINAN